MGELDSKERLKELYLPPAKQFVLVDVPELQFIMVDGTGSPDAPHFADMIRWLFAVLLPIKRVAREHMGRSYVEPPLECLFWSDDPSDLVAGRKEKLKWRLMIVATADWMSGEIFDRAVAEAGRTLGEIPSGLRLASYAEGRSAQILHVGPPSGIPAAVDRLHHEFLPARRLVPNGHHHEIYLNDPRRVAPESVRTVLRQPVRDSSGA